MGNNFLKKIKFPKKFTFLLTRSIKQSNELKKNINLKNFNFLNCPMLKIKPIKLTKNKIKEIKVDCDSDSLIYLVEPAGPACHTGERTCFHNSLKNG